MPILLRIAILSVVLISICVGSYLLLFPKIVPGRPSGPVETASWLELVDTRLYDFMDDPKNWDYVDSLPEDQLADLWAKAEAATNPAMDGKRVQIPGFMVSLDLQTDRQVEEFIFVPYMGACIHTPPPPPNQTIFVKAPGGTKVWDNWEPVEIIGTLKIEQSEHDIASAGFTLEMESIKAFDYDRSNPDYAVAEGAHRTN